MSCADEDTRGFGHGWIFCQLGAVSAWYCEATVSSWYHDKYEASIFGIGSLTVLVHGVTIAYIVGVNVRDEGAEWQLWCVRELFRRLI